MPPDDDDKSLAEQIFAAQAAQIANLLRFFDNDHLPPNLQAVAEPCKGLAYEMARELPTGPELTAGLRKLLEAKDCLVRAAL